MRGSGRSLCFLGRGEVLKQPPKGLTWWRWKCSWCSMLPLAWDWVMSWHSHQESPVSAVFDEGGDPRDTRPVESQLMA